MDALLQSAVLVLMSLSFIPLAIGASEKPESVDIDQVTIAPHVGEQGSGDFTSRRATKRLCPFLRLFHWLTAAVVVNDISKR
jgi:hypothetical protein